MNDITWKHKLKCENKFLEISPWTQTILVLIYIGCLQIKKLTLVTCFRFRWPSTLLLWRCLFCTEINYNYLLWTSYTRYI